MSDYRHEQVWLPFSETLLDWDEDFHSLMLSDRLRMKAYRKAIFEVVKPGDRVLDLGTGTGILSQWALEAGAAKVYGIDLNAGILDEALQRMRAAGFSDRFEPINKLSYDTELPERVDLLISEIMGNMADNEDFQPILQDAIKRFLKPDGTALPQSAVSYLVPVSAPDAHRDLSRGNIHTLGPHYNTNRLYREKGIRSRFNLYYDALLPEQLYLSRPQQLRRYGGAWNQPPEYRVELDFHIDKLGTLGGFKSYFIAQLSATTPLDISDSDIAGGKASDSWKHAYLPIEAPIEVRRGDRLRITFSRSYPQQASAFRQIYHWRGWVEREGEPVGHFEQCMDEARLEALPQPA